MNESYNFAELVHYYEVRMAALSDFSSRTWNRFNWFMTLHLGAFGFIFSNLVKVSKSEWYDVASIVLSFTALVWMLLGNKDYFQMTKYSQECKNIEKVIVERFEKDSNIIFAKATAGKPWFSFKQAKLLYLFPLLVLVAWIMLCISV